MGQTLVEKIVERFAAELKPGQKIFANDFVAVKPFHVMTHDNTGAVIPKFESMGAGRIFDPQQPIIALDHDVQNNSPENLAKYAKIEAFAKKYDLAFFPAKSGIAHQIVAEEGFALPGTLVVGSDSHSNIYGALTCVGTPVVRTDAAAIWATGQTWWQVPEIAKVNFTGKLKPGVRGKDVILALIGTFANDEVLNYAIEFAGEGLSSLSMDQRLTIANMTTEWGALVGIFPYDNVLRSYLLKRAVFFEKRGDSAPRITRTLVEEFDQQDLKADPDAYYAKEITIDLSSISPTVAGPNEVKTSKPLYELESQKLKIDKAYLLSCVAGRLEDFRDAAEIMKGKRVAPQVEFYLAAASANVEKEVRELGYWDILVQAGAKTLPPGCGPCIGLGEGVLEPGEVAISATNRNFKGRMGSTQAQVYLASPAVVAASALSGFISSPSPVEKRAVVAEIKTNPVRSVVSERVEIIDGFPKRLEGELLFIPKDNMNTDLLFGKEFTYQDSLYNSPVDMGKKALLNYDPEFQTIAREGDILVGGWNFGSGSSREQAATTLKYRGIKLVIAGSFSQTYKRNAFNNGFIVIESPELVVELKEKAVNSAGLTIRSGENAVIDFETSKISCLGKLFDFPPLGKVAQQLVVLDGFENFILARLEGLKS